MRKVARERVKIAATIGPASADHAVLSAMLLEGVDAIRINASHCEPEDVVRWVRMVRRASKAVDRDVAVMLDLQGIKRRIGDLAEPVELEDGQRVVFGARGGGRIPLRLAPIKEHLGPGDDLFLDDGFIRMQVLKVRRKELHCEVVRGGTLTSRAGVNLPGVPVSTRIPTARDLQHVTAGVEAGIDLFALSFVRSASDLERCRRHTNGIPIIAKIERPEAVKDIDAVAAASDGLLVARGDLAVEMEPEQLPVLQKSLVGAANRARKPVIVATEMLASMVHSPRPTRAELTDVGNAVLDGADAMLLSDETAIGHDPPRAVRYMARIIKTVEGSIMHYDLEMPQPRGRRATRPDWALADAAVETAVKVKAHAIVAVTGSGRTAMLVSAGRPSVPLYAFSPDQAVCRRVALMWGVMANRVPRIRDPDRLIRHVLDSLSRRGCIERGHRVVVVFGAPLWAAGTKTNTVRIAVA